MHLKLFVENYSITVHRREAKRSKASAVNITTARYLQFCHKRWTLANLCLLMYKCCYCLVSWARTLPMALVISMLGHFIILDYWYTYCDSELVTIAGKNSSVQIHLNIIYRRCPQRQRMVASKNEIWPFMTGNSVDTPFLWVVSSSTTRKPRTFEPSPEKDRASHRCLPMSSRLVHPVRIDVVTPAFPWASANPAAHQYQQKCRTIRMMSLNRSHSTRKFSSSNGFEEHPLKKAKKPFQKEYMMTQNIRLSSYQTLQAIISKANPLLYDVPKDLGSMWDLERAASLRAEPQTRRGRDKGKGFGKEGDCRVETKTLIQERMYRKTTHLAGREKRIETGGRENIS